MDDYPIFNMEKMEIKRFEKLKKDFPEIDTEEKALSKSSIIVEYYNILLRNDIKNNISKLLMKKSSSRKVADLSPNAMELNYVVMHPIAGLGMKNGAENGDAWTKIRFGNVSIDDNNNVNAYRHAIWNMASVAEMLRLGMPKSDAVGKCRDFATLHEMEYKGHSNGIKPSALPGAILALHINWGLKTPNSTGMDLSNNAIGRSLIDDIAWKPLFGSWRNTSQESIMYELSKKVTPTSTYRQSADIINAYHSGNWDALASNRFGGTTTPLYTF